MTYQEVKQAVIEKVALQRCWRALNPDLEVETVEVQSYRYDRGLLIQEVWKRGPASRKAAVIRAILRSRIDQRVTAYNMTLPF